MAEQKQHEVFVSNATIYKSGAGHPFPPGTPVHLHPDHASEFRKAGLERVTPEPKAEGKASGKAPAAAEVLPGDALKA